MSLGFNTDLYIDHGKTPAQFLYSNFDNRGNNIRRLFMIRTMFYCSDHPINNWFI